MKNELMEAALGYAAFGWKVFPLMPGKKIPATEHGVKDATDDTVQIKAWWKKMPGANIGLACGRASGVYVVDIDRHGDTDGFVAANALALPETLSAATPNCGEHRFYVWTDGEEPEQGQKVNGHVGIDVRANGGYVVVAPSVVDGRPYKWNLLAGTYADAVLAEFPSVLKKRKAQALFPWETKPTAKAVAKPVAHAAAQPVDATSVRERASAYLATMDAAVQGCGGHNALLRAAEALVVRFALDDATALRLLWDEYNPRCIPPWDRADAKDVKDFERKVREAKKNPPHAYGDLKDADDCLAETISAEDEALADRLIGTVVRRAPEVVKPEEVVDKDKWTPEVLYPEGFIGDVTHWIAETAFRHQPVYALGGAIALAATMLGRRVTDEYGTRTNLYCSLIGPSSSGKDYPLKSVQNILTLAGANGHIGADVTCDTVIEGEVSESPVKLYCIDEAGYFFSSISDATGEGSYRKSIISTFMKLFSSSNSFYYGKRKVGQKDRCTIDQPCVSMLCNSTPRKMYATIKRDQLEDGWIPRCLFFISNKIPEKTVRPTVPPPAALVETVHHWVYRFTNEGNLTSVNGPYDPNGTPRLVTFTRSEAARQKLEEWDRYCDARLREANKEGNECDLLYGKSAEIVARLALVQAACRDRANTTVEEKDVTWAISVATAVVESMRKGITTHVADSDNEKWQKSILRTILEAGASGITKTELWRKCCRGLDKKRKEDLLNDLQFNQDLVDAKAVTTAGAKKPTVIYYAKKEAK